MLHFTAGSNTDKRFHEVRSNKQRSLPVAVLTTAMDAYDHASESELRQPLDQLLRDVMKLEKTA